jgi:hypothetical protein
MGFPRVSTGVQGWHKATSGRMNTVKEDLYVALGMGLGELQQVICFRAVDGTGDWIYKYLGRGKDLQ